MIKILGLSIDPNDIEGSIVTSGDALIEKTIADKFPSTTGFKTLDPLIEATTNTIRELVDKYVLAKGLSGFGNLLTAAANKWPAIAPEVDAIKAKLKL